MKRIAIIGAGNMGAAIARGIMSQPTAQEIKLTVSNPSQGKLDQLQANCPGIETTHDNAKAVEGADLVILAVKPWIIPSVVAQIIDKIDLRSTAIASLAAGIALDDLAKMVGVDGSEASLYRIMPNTAIAVGESMTFICASSSADEGKTAKIAEIFQTMGKAEVIEERQMNAAMALCSCGIAYAMRYVRAATEGAVELGLYADKACQYTLQTLRGAVALLEATGAHPESEIDRVTTPGGVTIKGLNAMEQSGFTAAVINGLKAYGGA